MRRARIRTIILFLLILITPAAAEDGYDLWLRYPRVEASRTLAAYRSAVGALIVAGESPTAGVISDELNRGLTGMLGHSPATTQQPADGTLVVAALDQLSELGVELADGDALRDRLGHEGYLIRATVQGDRSLIVITANGDRGLLYGTFAFLRHLQAHGDLAGIDLASTPRIEHRVLQHWDNLDGSTERVYSEDPRSIWWNGGSDEPPVPVQRWRDYARACASIGINVVVLNNVNASTDTLLPPALRHAGRIADVLRPYGIRVALSANFAAPLKPDRKFRLGPGIGQSDTADPTDPGVINWWQAKIDEIHGHIPDFAGFLVKAGSEGMPGPESTGAQASTGANMLGRLLAPHGGILMWRTFTWDDGHSDLVQRQHIRFAPQDQDFLRGNVFLQSKFGPRDFMPREPFHPLFGAMTHTQLSMELQITQEYTGHDKYLMYWGPLWQEILNSDTHVRGEGSTVARVIDGSLHAYDSSQIAGVANVSRVRNWTGHPFAQANWYAFGRFAWNPEIDPRNVAEEWVRQTWGNRPAVVRPLVAMMMQSHETMVDYVAPLGMGHTNTRDGAHYEPGPNADDYWQKQFINASAAGIGRDRTVRSGTGATAQYQPPVAAGFEDRDACPPGLLLWFHHVGWTEQLHDGQTVWQTLVGKYNRGVAATGSSIQQWKSLKAHIDDERYQVVLKRLETQHQHSRKFRRLWLAHFQQLNGLPMPAVD